VTGTDRQEIIAEIKRLEDHLPHPDETTRDTILSRIQELKKKLQGVSKK